MESSKMVEIDTTNEKSNKDEEKSKVSNEIVEARWSMKGKILSIIQARANKYESNLIEKAKVYSCEHFEGGNKNDPYKSPLEFKMFELPAVPPNGFAILWCYRRVLEGVLAVLKNDEIKRNSSVKLMRQYIYNLVGKPHSMSSKYLEKVSPRGFLHLWFPASQTLEDLLNIVSNIADVPKPKELVTEDEVYLQIVILTLMSNLALLMQELGSTAKSLQNDLVVETNKEKESP